MDKVTSVLMTVKDYVLIHPKAVGLIVVCLVIALIVVSAGCAWLREIDKGKAAYNAAYAATKAYLAEQGQLPAEYQLAVQKVWEAFRDNSGKVTAENISTLPSVIKADYLSKIPDAAVKAKAEAVVDKIWADVQKVVTLTGCTPEDVVKIIDGIKLGVQAAIAENDNKSGK